MIVARCIVTRLHANVSDATISCGPYKGEAILLSRIPLIPSDSELPFQFRCLQFPSKPCFSMSISQSQDQAFKAIGVDLSVSCFTHGQLYVAASRACSTSKLSIFAPTIRRVIWSTQKPGRTEERFIMLLDFYISLAMEDHLIYINCPMYPTGKAGYLRYLLLLNHPNKLFIQKLVVY